MKITGIFTEHYKWPKEKPLQNGKHVFTHNEINLAIVETDEGITGYGTSYSTDYVDYLSQFLIDPGEQGGARLPYRGGVLLPQPSV